MLFSLAAGFVVAVHIPTAYGQNATALYYNDGTANTSSTKSSSSFISWSTVSTTTSSVRIGDVVAAAIGLSTTGNTVQSSSASFLESASIAPATAVSNSTTRTASPSIPITGSTSSSSAALTTINSSGATSSHDETSSSANNGTASRSLSANSIIISSQPSGPTLISTAASTGSSNTTSTNITATGCLAALASFASANNSWLAQPGHLTAINTTYTIVDVAQSSDVQQQSAYTLCDGWPRVNGSYNAGLYNTTLTATSSTTIIATPYPTRPPTCSLESAACEQWWTMHWSCSTSSLFETSVPSSCVPYMISEPCSQPADFTITDRGACGNNQGQCTIYGDMMQMYYWPVTREDYNVCNKTGFTVTDNSPTIAVVGTATITSPFVAFSLPAISAYDGCGLIGTVMEDVVLSIPASEVSSGNGNGMHMITSTKSFNFGDLPPNIIPASAWMAQQACDYAAYWFSQNISGLAAWTTAFESEYPFCGTIWASDYVPDLVAPTQINQLQPGWISCGADFGLYDPPKALQTVVSAAGVTTSEAISTPPPALPAKTTTIAQPTSKSSSDPTTPTTPAQQTPTSVIDPGTPDPSSLSPGQSIVTKVSSSSNTSPGDPADPRTSSDAQSSLSKISPDPASVIVSILESAASNGIVVGSSIITISGPTQSAPGSVLLVGGSTLTASASGDAVFLGSAKLTEGGAAQTVNGQTVSLGSNGLVIGSSTVIVVGQSLHATASGAVVTGSNGQLVTVLQSGTSGIIEAGTSRTTVPLGAQITLAGQIVSLPASGGGVILDGSSVAFSNARASASSLSPSQSETVVPGTDGQLVTVLRSGSSLLVEDASAMLTLAPGEQTTLDGQTISAPRTGSNVVVDGSMLVTTNVKPTQSSYPEIVITGADGQTFTVLQEGSSLVLEDSSSTTTLAGDSLVTFDGKTISAPTSTGFVLVDGSSVPLSRVEPSTSVRNPEPIASASQVTANAGSRLWCAWHSLGAFAAIWLTIALQ